MDDSMAGESTLGDSMADESMADESMADESKADESIWRMAYKLGNNDLRWRNIEISEKKKHVEDLGHDVRHGYKYNI